MKGDDGKRPDCFACAHFYVTWDERFPRGCRVLGFKSRRLPSAVVKESSGSTCQLFRPKKTGA